MVVACVVEREGRFLMVEELAGGQRAVLNQPAGHWEPGETLIEAARRETLEETGWDVEPEHLLGIYEFKPVDLEYSFLRIAFSARALRHHPLRALDEGILRALWLTPDELKVEHARHRSPMVQRCVDDHRAGQRYPLSLIAHLTPSA